MSSWTQVDITTSTQGVDVVSGLLTRLNLGSIAIQDAEDFKRFLSAKDVYWDYIEDELMGLTKAPTIVTVYLSELEQGTQQLAAIRQGLADLKKQDTENLWGPLTFSTQRVHEEDWATAWKEHYHPVSIGKRLLVCPTWEDCTPKEGQIVVQMDPGMAFGTGTHESTHLCLEELDAISTGGERVLDIGTGSGILAISALLLGGSHAFGVDIDQVAVGVARENAKVNQVSDRTAFREGSFTQHAEGPYDIVFANIVADAILHLAPEVLPLLAEGGSFITSGIIDSRGEEVKAGLEAAGFAIVSTREKSGWISFRGMRKEDV